MKFPELLTALGGGALVEWVTRRLASMRALASLG